MNAIAQHLTNAMKRIEFRAERGAAVGIRDLRKEFPMLSKEQFDYMVREASRTWAISVHCHDFVTSLTPAEVAELVDISPGSDRHPNDHRYVICVAIRQS